MVAERRLHRMHAAVGLGKALDSQDRAALGLHGQHVAALDRRAVHMDGTGAALGGVATDVRPG